MKRLILLTSETHCVSVKRDGVLAWAGGYGL